MAIAFNDNINPKAPKILDNRYSKNGVTPYVDVAEANSTIPITYRSKGLTVLIGNQEYWYRDGITDVDLVAKGGGSTSFCTLDLHKDVIIGSDVNFVHADGSLSIDNIDTDVSITRVGSDPIYNPILEAGFNWGTILSPEGTKWNWSTWGDLKDVASRHYLPFYEALEFEPESFAVGAELVMWDTINNKYYKFSFSEYSGSSSAFAYTRNLVTITCDGTIHFSDGTTMDSKVIDNKNIFIVDDVFGDDATAEPNNMLKPYKTIDKAIHDAPIDQNYILTYTVSFGTQFTLGEHITTPSGGQGEVVAINSPTSITILQATNSPFVVGEVMTGDTSGAQATIDTLTYILINSTWIYVNPSPNQYIVEQNLWYLNGRKVISYYFNKGVDVFLNNSQNFNSLTADNLTFGIYGEGNLSSFNFNFNSDVSGVFTLECNNWNLLGNFTTNGLWAVDTVINVKGKLTVTNGLLYIQNINYWLVATEPTKFTLTAYDVEVTSSSTSLFLIYGCQVQLNINIQTYKSNIVTGSNPDIWCSGGTPPTTFKVTSYINIKTAIVSRTTSYSAPIFTFVTGSANCTTFITGVYYYTGRGTFNERSNIITFDANCVQNVYFDGFAHITKGGFFLDLYGGTSGNFGYLKARGKIYIDNSTLAFGYEWTGFFISQSKVVIEADLIMDSPANYGIMIGSYNNTNPIGLPQIDVNDCQIVNTDVAGIAPAVIIKNKNVFGGVNIASWGTLRLKNVKIVSTGATSIEGGTTGVVESIDVYSAYANKAQVNILNAIAGTTIITDVNVTSNNN